ncbi:hypothetical protein A9G37_06910 [Gilliamella sp. GillExp13]|nr:hypothetical protein A9G37_06910 [Gilliamella apicola]
MFIKSLITCYNSLTDEKKIWLTKYSPGTTVQVSGIYKCTECNKEVTCNKDDPFPPPKDHEHIKETKWKLIVEADTKGKGSY